MSTDRRVTVFEHEFQLVLLRVGAPASTIVCVRCVHEACAYDVGEDLVRVTPVTTCTALTGSRDLPCQA